MGVHRMNPLHRFFHETDEPLALFARRCGIGADVLEAVIEKPESVDLDLLRVICRETGDVVQPGDLLNSDAGGAAIVDFPSAIASTDTHRKSDTDALTDEAVNALRAALQIADLPGPPSPALLEIYGQAIAHTYLTLPARAGQGDPNKDCLSDGFFPAGPEALPEDVSDAAPGHCDRLAQALQPVLEEILASSLAPREAASRSHKVAHLAARSPRRGR